MNISVFRVLSTSIFLILATHLLAQPNALADARVERDSLIKLHNYLEALSVSDMVLPLSEAIKNENPRQYLRDVSKHLRLIEKTDSNQRSGVTLGNTALAFGDEMHLQSDYYYLDIILSVYYLYGDLFSFDSLMLYADRTIVVCKTYHPEDKLLMAKKSAEVAGYLFEIGKNKEGVAAYEAFITFCEVEEIEKDAFYASIMMNYASYWYEMENYDRAMRILESAINPDAQAESLPILKSVMASVAFQMGDLSSADFLLRESMPQIKALSGPQSQFYAYGMTTQVSILIELELFNEALAICDSMMQILQQPELEQDYNFICFERTKGELLCKMGREQEGMALVKQSVDRSRVSMMEGDANLYYTFMSYVVVLIDNGQWGEAEAILKEARKVGEALNLNLETESTYQNMFLAIAIAKKDYQSCIENIEARLTKSNDPNNYINAQKLFNLAKLHYLNNNPTDCYLALAQYSKVSASQTGLKLGILSESQRLEFTKSNQQYVSLLCTAAEKNPSPFADLLWQHAVFSKGLLLRSHNFLLQNINEQQDPALKAIGKKWLEERRTLAKIKSLSTNDALKIGYDLALSEHLCDSLERLLNNKLPGLFQPENEDALQWKNLAQALQPNEALVDITRFTYFVEEQNSKTKNTGYLALVVTSANGGTIDPVFFKNGNEMETFLAEWHRSAIQDNSNLALPEGLQKAFWQPIAKFLPSNINKLYWVPDGVFHHFALEALPSPQKSTLLLDQIQVVRLFNSSDLLLPKSLLHKEKNSLLIGNPRFNQALAKSKQVAADFSTNRSFLLDVLAFNPPALTPLPGSEIEVNRLATLLQNANYSTQIFLDTAAQESVLQQMPQTTLVHIATHGLFQDVPRSENSHPMLRNMLFFSGADNTLENKNSSGLYDGILTAYEASTLPLQNTYLTTLSACHTGVSQWLPGEGAFGMPRALHMAGSKHTLVSLWEVEDQIDQELLLSFYTNMLSGIEIHESLQRAKVKHRILHPAPKYWAGWILTGR